MNVSNIKIEIRVVACTFVMDSRTPWNMAVPLTARHGEPPWREEQRDVSQLS